MGSSVSRARTLRSSMTGVELLLWSRLRRQQLGGRRFRRQAPIGPYIADFACFQARLLIEIDGPTHDARIQYDDRRTAWLVRRGFRVLRFSADDVLSRLDEVLETILLELADSAGPPSPGSAGDSPDSRGRD
jgi:very-short-patch-repair endonuclease